jgi:DNA-binding XRE family transcriptional regulator
MNPDTKQLRMMRKKARVSLRDMAKELGLPLGVVRNIERFPWVNPAWADRYVEALTKLTA